MCKNLFCLIALSILFVACKKKSSTPSSGSSSSSNDLVITATIDGKSFNAENFVWSDGFGYLNMNGSKGDEYFSLGFDLDNDTVGTYAMPEFKFSYVKNHVDYYARSGSYTITKNDTVNDVIQGTFNFSATDDSLTKTYNITNGVFNLKY